MNILMVKLLPFIIGLTLLISSCKKNGNGESSPASSTTTYEALILSDSPVGYWRLSESGSTTAVDLSSNNQDGTYVGTYTQGAAAALFGDTATSTDFAVTSSVTISDNAPLNPASEVTIEAWIFPDADSGQRNIFAKGAGPQFQISTFGQAIVFTLTGGCGGANGAQYGTVGFTAYTWNHLVWTYDGTTATLHINGNSQSITPGYGALCAISGGTGITIAGASNGKGQYVGSIQEVAIYDYVLSNTQIAQHYSAGLSGTFP